MQTVPRLIDHFIPTHYDLSLVLDRPGRTFEGTVTIQGSSVSTEAIIRLHAKDLAIDTVLVDGKQATFSLAADADELQITRNSITPGPHVIVIGYHAIITDSMHGLYPSYYEHNGVKKELLATQFESHHAREVFPCVDEPAAKATFAVTLTTEPDITVLGNQPIDWQRTENGRLVTAFQTTPKMSTYLLAWVTGELHSATALTASGVEVNVWATPAQPASSLTFALSIATRTIEFYETYFDTPYPLPKSDHVALPDFSSGAMENWGLVTYREIALLADTTTSISSKQYIATVIAHELAHQWFGNLVTMQWWNNLWLNESFATLMEYVAIDALHPEWDIWLEFVTGETIMALRRDSIDGVQAVQTDVNHPDEISTIFDGAIVYAKGARLLRMLQQHVGSAAFQAGLTQYFKDHAYGNTEGDDLWNAIAAASGEDIASLMNTWISQPGYPVLHVSQEGEAILLQQEQFFTGPHKPSMQIWPIPLNASSADMPRILAITEASVRRTDNSPLRFNVGDSAHFITHYTPELLEEIIAQLEAGELSVVDRAQLLDEASLLARGGILPSAQLIDLVGAYRYETREPVWGVVAMILGELRKFTEGDQAATQALRELSATVAAQQYARLGWFASADESDEDRKLRTIILGLVLYSEQPEAIAQALELYTTSDLLQLDPELRPLIISAAARHGADTTVEALLDLYATTSSSDLQQDIIYGVTSTRSAAHISQLLANIKNPAIVRPQDAARWFVYLVRGEDSRQQAWDWLTENWQWVIDTFSGDKSYDDFPRYSAGALSSRPQLEAYQTFFAPLQDIPALSRVIAMGIKEIEGRVALIERDRADVVQRLLGA